MLRNLIRFEVAAGMAIPGFYASAQDAGCDANFQAARKAANPLADICALMTDNTVAFNTGSNDEDSCNFQLQPVYALPVSLNAKLVLRGIIPF